MNLELQKDLSTLSPTTGKSAGGAAASKTSAGAIATVGETTSEVNAGSASCLPNISLVAELTHTVPSRFTHISFVCSPYNMFIEMTSTGGEIEGRVDMCPSEVRGPFDAERVEAALRDERKGL